MQSIEAEYKKFMNTKLIQASVIREIEIIGEATKKLNQEFKGKYDGIVSKFLDYCKLSRGQN